VSRPAVLLLHAFPLDARMWERQEAILRDAGFATVAPDLPGPDVEIGFSAWAQRILGLVDGDVLPVGCSMGGYLSLELWRQASDRIPALVLLDTRATPDTPEQRDGRDDAVRLLGEAGRAPFWEGLAPKLFARSVDEAVVERARRLALAQPVTALVAALETMRDRPDSTATLRTIDVPVLVAVGEDDRVTSPSVAEEMAEALPDARFLRIPGAGHLAPLERPDEVNELLLRFLQEVAP
jgi:3-oxoadipate enol-lactonase